MNQWKNAGYGLVIVQAIDPPPTYPPSVTGQQLDMAVSCGLAVDAYIYCWWDMARLQRDVATLGGQQAAIKQWQGTSTLAGVKKVDLNVVR